MLLVHDSAASDSLWMEAASIFLRDWGGFDVWLDFLHIPQSQHKDPLRWYSEAIKKAEIVAVVVGQAAISSPALDQRSTIYHHTFDLALELIASRISQRLRDKEANVLQHFIVLDANQASHASTSVPNACASFARFRMPHQMPELVNYVYRDRCECSKGSSISCNLTAPSSRSGHIAKESFESIYNRLRHSGSHPANHSPPQTHVDDAKHEAESTSLLDDKADEDYRNQRRERLDNEFGPNVVSISALDAINGERMAA